MARYTDKFLKLYLNVRDLFRDKPDIQEDGVKYKGIKNYDDPRSHIAWNDELLDIFTFEYLLQKFLTTDIAEEIEE